LSRVSVHDAKHIMTAAKVIRTAFKHQVDGTCFSLVEVLSTCPTNWGQPPIEACKWVETNMIPYYPLGDVKVPEKAVE
jgi:2-oxoglutarate/2-oxoacid ferredoxin oxidoreductase subunit beta